jgi:hypothetical protein
MKRRRTLYAALSFDMVPAIARQDLAVFAVHGVGTAWEQQRPDAPARGALM